MAQRCFAYVVLAALISSRVMAAPTAAASDDPNPAMCIDTTIPWKERLESCDPCQYPGIPGIPSNVKNQRCAGDGPETHGREQGIFRRDAASTGPQRGMVQAYVVLPSKRDSVQTLDTTDESLPVKAVTKGHWIETHDKASGIYARRDMLEGSKDVAANGIVEGQASANYDAVIHKPAPGVWRRRGILPVGAIAHERAHDIRDGGEKPHSERKREAKPVPLSREVTSISGTHLFPRQSSAEDSTPSAVSETPAPETPAVTTQKGAEQPAPDSIQAAAQRFKDKYPYTQPH